MAAAELVSIQQLADGVNRWCFEHGVVPANGQAGERITERNIRFYRARGILDSPGSGTGEKRRGFSEKHAGQLRAVRLLQARGVALDQIEERLRGLSLEQLQEFEREELRKLNGAGAGIAGGSAQENWLVTSIGGEYLLVSRRGRPVSDEQRRQIAVTLGVNAQGPLEER